MRTVQITDFGGPDTLRVVETEMPAVNAGDIRIRVQAAGVNPVDGSSRDRAWVAWAESVSGQSMKPPRVPGLEVAGTVDAVGEEAETGLVVGDAVMAPIYQGGYADYVVVNAKSVVAVPPRCDSVHAATIPMGGLTALVAVEALGLEQGDWVMVTGAAGVVGGYAAQIAKHQGLRVIADAADSDRAFVESLGVDQIVERGDGALDAVRALQPSGVSAVVDTALLGPAIVGAVRDGGTLTTLRQPGEPGTTPIPEGRNVSVRGVYAPDYYNRPDKMQYLVDLVDAGALTLRVAGTFPFERTADAHRLLDSRGVRGRIVLVP